MTELYVGLAERVEELVKEHGVRGLARRLLTDPGYITRLRKGEKENPDDELLAEMGLGRITTYERIVPNPNHRPGEEGTFMCTCQRYPHRSWCGRYMRAIGGPHA
jgi:hypothetical protein